MISGKWKGAAQEFMAESDAQNGMADIFVIYNGESPEKAFKIIDTYITKVVDDDCNIAQMRTTEFIGGVIFSLAEDGTLDQDWTDPNAVLGVCLEVGKILGARREKDRLIHSANNAVVMTQRGPMIPGDWLRRLM